MSLRTLIVDDEEPARVRLRQLLTAHDDVEVVGEAGDGAQAIERVAELRPDVVLLDIQMPGCTGLEVAGSLGEGGPAVIFCTAFDQYAVDAFELQAVDYLLKPVSRARLEAALDRVRGATGRDGEESPADRLLRAPGLVPARFLARRGARYLVVPSADALAFTFEEGVTRVITATEVLTMQPTLAQLERRLDPQRFFQVSRAAIVGLDAVKEAKPMSDGTGQVVLSNGTVLAVSRRRWRELLDALGG